MSELLAVRGKCPKLIDVEYVANLNYLPVLHMLTPEETLIYCQYIEILYSTITYCGPESSVIDF